MGARNSERFCTNLSPVARFPILTRSHQRELRARLKEQLRGCPSSALKNLSKFQSWTSLLSVGNMNARSSLIRSACCIFSFASYELCQLHPLLLTPDLWLLFGDKRPLKGQVRLPWQVRTGSPGSGGPGGDGGGELEKTALHWEPGRAAPRRAPGAPGPAPPALQQAAAPRSRPGRRRADTPALGERRTSPGQPRTAEGRSARGGCARGRRVQRGAGVSRTRCRRGRRSSVPAPAARPREGERRLGGPGAGRERRGRAPGRGLGASGLGGE